MIKNPREGTGETNSKGPIRGGGEQNVKEGQRGDLKPGHSEVSDKSRKS